MFSIKDKLSIFFVEILLFELANMKKQIESITKEIKHSKLHIVVLNKFKDFLGANAAKYDNGRVYVSSPQLFK